MDNYWKMIDGITKAMIDYTYALENPIINNLSAYKILDREQNALYKFQNDPLFNTEVELAVALLKVPIDEYLRDYQRTTKTPK